MRWILVASAFAACTGGSAEPGPPGPKGDQGVPGAKGDQGDVGPSGPQGPAGSDAPAQYHWADADGVRVTDGPLLVYLDPTTGFLWQLDPATGDLKGTTGIQRAFYQSRDCTGQLMLPPTFMAGISPRVVLRVGTLWAVATDRFDAPITSDYESTETEVDGCVNRDIVGDEGDGWVVMLPAGDAPALPFVAPFHPEN